MGEFNTRWVLEDRVVFVEVSGVWDEASLKLINQDFFSYLNQTKSPPIHFVVDASHLVRTASIFVISKQIKFTSHRNLGWIITLGIGHAKLIRSVFEISEKMLGVRAKNVPTLDDALALLNQLDETLPDLKPLRDQLIPPG